MRIEKTKRIIDGSRWAIIPIETKNRELSAKTLLACALTERNFNVVLGESTAIRNDISHLPAGVFIDKSMAPSRAIEFQRYRHWGHSVATWCEEGLVFPDDQDYLIRKVAEKALEQVDAMFAWGPYQASLIKNKYPEFAERVHATGNPRIDLLRHQLMVKEKDMAEDLRKEYGRFLLINSNFSRCNYQAGHDAFMSKAKNSGKLEDPYAKQYLIDSIEYKRRIMDAFLSAIDRLANEHPEIKIIVRPHPTENHSFWTKFASKYSSVESIHEGPVLPWLAAAEMIVHNGCTTGVEALLLNQPVIAYQPVKDSRFDMRLPNACCFSVTTENDLLDYIDRVFRNDIGNDFRINTARKSVVEEYITGIDGVLACDRIAEILNDIAKPLQAKNRRPWYPLWKFSLPTYLKSMVKLNKYLGDRPPRRNIEIQKFPHLHLDELESIIGKFSDSLGRFDNLTVKCLAHNIFYIGKRN